MELLPLIFTCIWVIHAIRKSLETAKRLPEWDKMVLSGVWIGSAVFFALVQLPPLRFLGETYGELICLILLATMYQLRDYQPARLYAIALLPFTVIYAFNALLRTLSHRLFEHLHEYLEPAQVFSSLWMVGFGIYAYTQNKHYKFSSQGTECPD